MMRAMQVVPLAVLAACTDGSEARRVWGGAPVEPLDMRAGLSADRVPLLGALTCTVDVYAGRGCEIEFAPAIPEGFQGSVREARALSLGPGTWRRWLLELRPTRLGTLSIPPMRASQRGGDAFVTSSELTVEVESRLREAGPEIEAPAPPFPPRPSLAPWLLGAGGLALAALAMLLWRARRARAPRFVETAPPPHAAALRALARLRTAPRATAAEIEAFYVEVSAVLRVYLEERFGLHAPERTTEEFLADAQASALLDVTQRAELGRFLSQCDLVKFARVRPGEDVHSATLAQAEDFVEATRPDRVAEVVA
jgi:hypothetical protein